MERQYADLSVSRSRILRQIEAAYSGAPQFGSVFQFLRQALMYEDTNIATFNTHLLRQVMTRLGIVTPVLLSSSLPKNDRLRGQERVIGICKCIGATHYVNPIGGVALYKAERFAHDNLKLNFLNSTAGLYEQFGQPPVPSLSIVDVMMFNGPVALSRALGEFELV